MAEVASMIRAESAHGVFLALERELNRRANRSGELRLTVPFIHLLLSSGRSL